MVGSGSQERSVPNKAMRVKIAADRRAREETKSPPPKPPQEGSAGSTSETG